MRLGTVIGRITLTLQEPAYKGGCLLLVQPFSRAQFAGDAALPLAPGSSLVVFDRLGAATAASSASPRAPRRPSPSTVRRPSTPTSPAS